MPIPHELLKAAIAALPNTSLERMACHNGIPADLPRGQIVERLASDDGLNLQSYSSHMSIPDLQKVAKVFGIDTSNPGPGGLSYAVWKFIYDYDKNRKREQFHQETGTPPLSGDELLAEVQKMARPCIHLTSNPEDGPFAGVWRGPGIVPIDLPEHEHWITLDCVRLPEEFASHQLTGAASVYANEGPNARTGEFKDGGCVALDPQCVFNGTPKPSIRIGGRTLFPGEGCGEALYARPGTSFPSPLQVIDFPTPTIRDWLARMGYSFKAGDYDSLPAKELRDVYEDVVARLDPARNDEGIAAVVGGWGIDIEFAYAVGTGNNYQLVFTLWESEPWIQAIIGKKTGKFFVRQLIT